MIEKRLFAGELLGVACTCALELGESCVAYWWFELVATSSASILSARVSILLLCMLVAALRGGYRIAGRYRSTGSPRSNVDALAAGWPGMCSCLLS